MERRGIKKGAGGGQPAVRDPAVQLAMRRNGTKMRNALMLLMRGPFATIKENMRVQRVRARLARLGEVVESRRDGNIRAAYVGMYRNMIVIRKASKMMAKLNRFFKGAGRNRYEIAFRRIIERSYVKLKKQTSKVTVIRPLVFNRCFEKIRIKRQAYAFNQLKQVVIKNRDKIKGLTTLDHNIKKYIKLRQAQALSKIVSYSVLIQTKRKHRRFVRSGTTTPDQVQPPQPQRPQTKQLKKQLQTQLRKTRDLQKQIKLLKSQQSHPLSNSHHRSPRQLSKPQPPSQHSSRAASISSSRARSTKSVLSEFSESKSVFSVNTKNLLRKIQSASNQHQQQQQHQQSSSNHCCKYRTKYSQLMTKNRQLERMLEMKDDECKMLEEINKHIEETIDKELGRMDQVGEVAELMRHVKQLEAELEKVKAELQEVGRQRENEKKRFKRKLQGILDKLERSRRE